MHGLLFNTKLLSRLLLQKYMACHSLSLSVTSIPSTKENKVFFLFEIKGRKRYINIYQELNQREADRYIRTFSFFLSSYFTLYTKSFMPFSFYYTQFFSYTQFIYMHPCPLYFYFSGRSYKQSRSFWLCLDSTFNVSCRKRASTVVILAALVVVLLPCSVLREVNIYPFSPLHFIYSIILRYIFHHTFIFPFF